MIGDVWAEVFNSDWQRRADAEGPVNLLSASVTRVLDGCGTISFETLGTDERAIRLLTNEARVKIYVNQGGVIRQFCSGIVRKIRKSYAASGWTRGYEGPDALDELKRYSVLLNRQFASDTVADVARELAALAGWTVEVEIALLSELMSARFDGVSVLKALQRVIELKGYHLREKPRPLSSFDRTLEMGALGTDIGLTCLTLEQAVDINDNDAIALIESLQVTAESEEVINWLLPLGGGEGEAALTLEKSFRSGILTTTGPDGKTLYYITDPSSVAQYGEIQKVGTFKDISPIANSDAAKILAANALYDTARAYLDRAKLRQDVYRMTLKKCRQLVRPGDMVRVIYRGEILDENGVEIPDEIVDGTFWVLKASERVSNDGSITTSLEISNVDKQVQDAATLVVDTIERLEVRDRTPQPNSFPYEVYGRDYICGSSSAAYRRDCPFFLDIDDNITGVFYVKLKFSTEWPVLFAEPYEAAPNVTRLRARQTLSGGLVYPRDLRLYINNVDVTDELGGPWSPAPRTETVEVDISTYIENAEGGIYQTHKVEFQAGEYDDDISYAVFGTPAYPFSSTDGEASAGFVQVRFLIGGSSQPIRSL